MRHSPDFHRQINALKALAGRPKRATLGFPAALVAMVAAGTAIGSVWGAPRSSAPARPSAPLFENADPWAESRKSAELLKGQEFAPAPAEGGPAGAVARPARFAGSGAMRFGFCHTGGGTNCVVDGDTIWMGGEKIRIADIDAPETHPSRCAEEARLGNAATARLQALLNQGPVVLEVAGRDTDRYGRKLRVVTRGGRSLGDQLVAEGLARTWTGRRQPWC